MLSGWGHGPVLSLYPDFVSEGIEVILRVYVITAVDIELDCDVTLVAKDDHSRDFDAYFIDESAVCIGYCVETFRR